MQKKKKKLKNELLWQFDAELTMFLLDCKTTWIYLFVETLLKLHGFALLLSGKKVKGKFNVLKDSFFCHSPILI